MVAVRAFNAGEPFMETATFKILAYYMWNNLPVKSILVLEQSIITLLKINKVMIQEFPEGSFLRFSPFVDLQLITALHSLPLW